MRKRSAIVFLILLACETPKKQSLEVIDFDNVQEMPADLMIEKAILLDSDTSALLGEDVKIQYGESGFFIMNKANATGIHPFLPQGNILELPLK